MEIIEMRNGFDQVEEDEIEVREEKETGRLEAFSDGVFAIAVTLLILEIKVPTLTEDGQHIETSSQLIRALLGEWPSYVAYLTGFISIIIMWLNHHRLFSQIKRSTHALLLLNSLLLLVVTIIPFPTALLAEYISNPTSDLANVAIIVYASILFLLAVAFNLIWQYVSRNGLLDRNADPKVTAYINRSYNVGIVLYTIALAISFINALVSLIILIGLSIYYALPISNKSMGGS